MAGYIVESIVYITYFYFYKYLAYSLPFYNPQTRALYFIKGKPWLQICKPVDDVSKWHLT